MQSPNRPLTNDFTESIAVASLALALMFCASCTKIPDRGTAPPPPTRQYERDFLEKRVAHQQAAIEMAQACVQKAQRDLLRQFCSALIETESREFKQLESWLRQWYGVSAVPGARERATEGYLNFMNSVRTATGDEFENSFLRGLRVHHHEGVEESKECQARAVHEELRAMCITMVDEQEREDKQISAWICEWFRDCVER